MSHKSQKIAALIETLQGQPFEAHYLGYFECFNQQLFFEAHEVLEELWLPQRRGPNGLFYKGLIQLAGAFVHIQKQRPKPALALFKLAGENLSKYPTVHEALDLAGIQNLISAWTSVITSDSGLRQLPQSSRWPKLSLNS